MPKPYKYVPASVPEVRDYVGAMVIAIPNLVDSIADGGVPGAFRDLQEGLDLTRKKLGETLFLRLSEMGRTAHAHFEAGELKEGYFLLQDMSDLLSKKPKEQSC
jgi:hypothetical protein